MTEKREMLAVEREEMRPCPWCGETDHLNVSRVGSLTSDMPDRPYRVSCSHIDHDYVQGPVAYGKPAAIAAWNSRLAHQPHHPSLREALAPFAALLEDFETNDGTWKDLEDDYQLLGRIRRRRDEDSDPPRVTVGDFRKARSALSNRSLKGSGRATSFYISPFEPGSGGDTRVVMSADDGFAVAYCMGRGAAENEAWANRIIAALTDHEGGGA